MTAHSVTYRDVVGVGPPGSGKDEHLGALAAKGFELVHMSSELQRVAGDYPGYSIPDVIARGDLVEDYIVNRAWKAANAALNGARKVHNGTIRTAGQALFQIMRLLSLTDGKIAVVHFVLDEATCRKRIASREGDRPDDDPEIVKRRMQHAFGHQKYIDEAVAVLASQNPDRIDVIPVSTLPPIDHVRAELFGKLGLAVAAPV